MYGLGQPVGRPFELFVASRDLTVRRLYLRELAQGFMCAAVLRPLSRFIERQDTKALVTAELIKQTLSSGTGSELVSLFQGEF